MHEGLKLQFLPQEHESLKKEVQHLKAVILAKDECIDALGDLIDHLKNRIQDAPCLVARPGEATYECRHDDPCRVCGWRKEASKDLVEEWHLSQGIW